ncbi:MAG: hypothetical protein ABIG44_14350 [Planctomycetota bacterium]
MSSKHTKPSTRPVAESPAPYGTESARSHWAMIFWIVLYVAWLTFLLTLAAIESRH